MLNKASLHIAPTFDIQMEVNYCGLDIIMPQAFFYLGDVSAAVEQVHSP